MAERFSFIHCADLHLGEPFLGISPGMTGNWDRAINQATFQAFEKVVDVAIENRVDALLISGDVYNSDHHSLAAQMAFARELYRAAEYGIASFIIHGNHDPVENWRAEIPLPPKAHVFGADEAACVPLERNGKKLANVYGISYGTAHIYENLALRFQRSEDVFSIGMLHTEVGNKKSPYAPCSLEDLARSGMDYWALGHVHTRSIRSQSPYVVYPGNIQGRDITESGPRGCYLVEVGQYGTISTRFIETDSLRWMDMEVDISGFNHIEALIRKIRSERLILRETVGKPVILRLLFTGEGKLHASVASREGQEYILQALNEKEKLRHVFAYFALIEDHTAPGMDLKERRQLPDGLGKYLSVYDSMAAPSDSDPWDTLYHRAANRPELMKNTLIQPFLTKDMIQGAFKKAEMYGALLLQEEDENENH